MTEQAVTKRSTVTGGQKRGSVDTVGQRALAETRATLLEAIGITPELLTKTVQTQESALEATVKGSKDPNWDARLRAAEALQDLGVPKQHGNTQGSGPVVVVFPPWFEEMAHARTRHAYRSIRADAVKEPE